MQIPTKWTLRETSNIIHVHLREPFQGHQDYYFGSMVAIFEVLPESVVGTTYATLRTVFARRGYRIENTKCVIQRGRIIRNKRSNKN